MPGPMRTMNRSRPTAASCPTSGSATATTWSMPSSSAAEGPRPSLREVTIYEREGGAIARVIDAERGRPGARRLAAGGCPHLRRANEYRHAPTGDDRAWLESSRRASRWPRSIPPSGISSAWAGRSTSSTAAGRPTEEARTGWWHKISGPLSTVLMPLLAATAAFGLARSGKVLLRATIGMALGFAYFVADNFSMALGQLRRLPAVPRRLGTLPAVPADRRIRPDPAGRVASRA